MTDVFVTGGTGVLGRPVVQSLVARGDRVRVAAHAPGAERIIRELGAEPARVDLLDAAAVASAVADAEAVLHLATRIPPSSQMGKAAAWADNDRLRTEGTRNLVDAALAARVQTFVYPSVVLVYPDRGADWIDAQRTQPAPTAFVRSTIDAEEQVRRFAAAGRRGVSLRMGTFYGPRSGHTRDMLAYARKGLAAVVGPGVAYQSAVWIDDAAQAVVAALDRAPSGTYDVVDDEPVQRAELVDLIARAVGRRHVWRMPDGVMRLVLGKHLVAINGRSQRVSNRAFREATGWTPEVPSAREGWRRLAQTAPTAMREQRLVAS